MADNNEIKTENKPASSDPSKTETTITGGTPFKDEKKQPDMRLNVKSEALQEDPNKTLVTLTKPESGFKVKVVGPFNGESEAEPGTELRATLAKLNTDDDTFGRYKYRDEEGNPVSIRAVVQRDMTLTSILKV